MSILALASAFAARRELPIECLHRFFESSSREGHRDSRYGRGFSTGRMIRYRRRHPFIHPRSTDRSANFRTPLFRAHARLLLPIPATVSQLNTWLLVTPKWYVDKINFAEAITIRTSIVRALRDDGKIRALLAPTRAPRAPPPRREINSRILVHSPGICRPSHIAFAYPLDLAAILPGRGEAGYMAFAWQNLPTPALEG